jgi:hypothetical protein
MKNFKTFLEAFDDEIQGLPNIANRQRIQKVGGHLASRYGIDPSKAAAAQYRRLIDKVKKYTGSDDIDMATLSFKAMQDLNNVMETEVQYKEYLEELAVSTVLGLDEFAFINQLIQDGELKIDAQLVKPGNMNIEQELEEMEPPEEDPEASYSLAEVMFDDDEKKARRALANAFSQGTSLDAQYLFHMLEDDLNDLSDTLVQQYGFLVSFGTLMYYAMPPGLEGMASGMQGGQVNVDDNNEDQVYTITAKAIIFPVLIQEIIKGIYQYISLTSGLHGAEEGGLSDESDDIIVGSEISRMFRQHVSNEDSKYIIPAVQHMLIELDTDEIKKIFQSPNAKVIVNDIINFFKEQESQQ